MLINKAYVKLRCYVLVVVSVVVMSACTVSPIQEEISGTQYSYSVILKGITTQNSQRFINSLKVTDSTVDVETVELNSNYAEYRAWSQNDSGEMYNVIVSVLEKQALRAEVIYVANKFVIRNK